MALFQDYAGSIYAKQGGAGGEAFRAAQLSRFVALSKPDETGGFPQIPEQAMNAMMVVGDLFSRWNYGVAGVLDTVLGNGKPGEHVAHRWMREVFSGVGELEGDKEFYGEVLEQGGVGKGPHVLEWIPGYKGTVAHRLFNPSARGVAGFVLDVATDPATWVSKVARTAPKIFTRWGEARWLTPEGNRALNTGYRAQLNYWAKKAGVTVADNVDDNKILVEIGRSDEYAEYFGKAALGLAQVDEIAAVQVQQQLRREAGYFLTEGTSDIGQAVGRAQRKSAYFKGKGTGKAVKEALAETLTRSDDALISQADDAFEAAGKLFIEDGLRFRPYWGKIGIDIPLKVDVLANRGALKAVGFLSGVVRSRSTRAAAVMDWGTEMYKDFYQLFNRVPFLASKLPGYEKRQAEAWFLRSSSEHVASIRARQVLGEVYDNKALRQNREWFKAFARIMEDPTKNRDKFIALSKELGMEDPDGFLMRWKTETNLVGDAEVAAELLDIESYMTWKDRYVPRTGNFGKKDIEKVSELFPRSGKFTGPSLGRYAEARTAESFDQYLRILEKADPGLLDKVIYDPFEALRLRLGAHYKAMLDLQFADEVSKMYGLGSADAVVQIRQLLTKEAADLDMTDVEIENLVELMNRSGRINPDSYRQIIKEDIQSAWDQATRLGDTDGIVEILERYGLEGEARNIEKMMKKVTLENLTAARDELATKTERLLRSLEKWEANARDVLVAGQDTVDIHEIAKINKWRSGKNPFSDEATISAFAKAAARTLGVEPEQISEVLRLAASEKHPGDVAQVNAELLMRLNVWIGQKFETVFANIRDSVAKENGLGSLEEVANLSKEFKAAHRKYFKQLTEFNSSIGSSKPNEELEFMLDHMLSLDPKLDKPGALAEHFAEEIAKAAAASGKPDALMGAYLQAMRKMLGFFEDGPVVTAKKPLDRFALPVDASSGYMVAKTIDIAAEMMQRVDVYVATMHARLQFLHNTVEEHMAVAVKYQEIYKNQLEQMIQIRASHDAGKKFAREVLGYTKKQTKQPLGVPKSDMPAVLRMMHETSPGLMRIAARLEDAINQKIDKVLEATRNNDFSRADELVEQLELQMRQHDSIRKVAQMRTEFFDGVKSQPKAAGPGKKFFTKTTIDEHGNAVEKPMHILLHGTSHPDLKPGVEVRVHGDTDILHHYATPPGNGVFFSEDPEIAYWYAQYSGWHKNVQEEKTVPRILAAGLDPDAELLHLRWENPAEQAGYFAEMRKRQQRYLDNLEEGAAEYDRIIEFMVENGKTNPAIAKSAARAMDDPASSMLQYLEGSVDNDPWRQAEHMLKSFEEDIGRRIDPESMTRLMAGAEEALMDAFDSELIDLLFSPGTNVRPAELIEQINDRMWHLEAQRVGRRKPYRARRSPVVMEYVYRFGINLREAVEQLSSMEGIPVALTQGKTGHPAFYSQKGRWLSLADLQAAFALAARRTSTRIIATGRGATTGRLAARAADKRSAVQIRFNRMLDEVSLATDVSNTLWGRLFLPKLLKKAGYAGIHGLEVQPYFTIETVIHDTSKLTKTVDAATHTDVAKGYGPIMRHLREGIETGQLKHGAPNPGKLLSPDIKVIPNKEKIKAAWLARVKALPKPAQAFLLEKEIAGIRNLEDLEYVLRKYEPIIMDLDPAIQERVAKLYKPAQADTVAKIDPERLKYAGQSYVQHTWRHGPMKGKTYTIPKGIADDFANYDGLWQQNPEVQRILRVLDFINNTTKLSVTKYYFSFNSRNGISNTAASAADILIQAANPRTHARAIKILSGADGTWKDAMGNTLMSAQLNSEMLALGINTDKMLLAEMVGRGNRLDIPEWAARKLRIDGNKVVHFMLNAPQYIENEARALHYITLRFRGYSPADAAYNVNKFLFDYLDLSPFEQNVMRRIFPFYTWSRKNIQLQIANMAERPGYVGVQHKLLTRERGPEADALPDYVRGQATIQIYDDEQDGVGYITNIDLPVANLDLLWAGGVGKTLREHVAMMNPLVKMPFEIAMGMDSFSGQSIRGRMFLGRVGPAMDRNLPQWAKDYFELEHYVNKDGEKVYKANGTKVYTVFKALILGRLVSEGTSLDEFLRGIGQGDLRTGAAVGLRLLTGLQVHEFDLYEAQRARLQNRTSRMEDYLFDKGFLVEFNKRYPNKTRINQAIMEEAVR